MSLDVLELLADSLAPLSLGEIATRLGLGKATIHGVLSNLEARRYVERVQGRTGYRLGQRVWELGVAAGEFIELNKVAHEYLLKLTELSGESSQLSEYCSPGEVMYLDRVNSPNPVQAYIQIGRRAPAYCVATGKALLAFQSEVEIERVCAEPLVAYTPKTITDPERLRSDLALVRQRGFALNPGEYRGEIVGVAAPIRDHTDAVVASLSASGPAYRFSVERATELAPAMLETAAEISRKLGHQASRKRRA